MCYSLIRHSIYQRYAEFFITLQKLSQSMKFRSIKLSSFLASSLLFSFCTKEPLQSINSADSKLDTSITRLANIVPISSTNFILGMNGHPLSRDAYKSVLATNQIKLLKDLGIQSYRIDIRADAYGNVVESENLLELLKLAKAANVKVLPTIYLTGLDYNSDNVSLNNKGIALGKGFVEKYGSYLDTYELGNLEENAVLKYGTHGNRVEDYDLIKLRKLAYYLKGLNYAVKTFDANSKTIVNASWMHYTYLQALINEGVNYDIIGYQWYSNMDSNASDNFGISDISRKLSSLFTKPIWFTLASKKDGSLYGTEESQDEWFRSFVAKVRLNPAVKAVFSYELFDEPNLINVPDGEKFYGAVKWVLPYKIWHYKTIANRLFISAPSNTFQLGINGHPLSTAPYLNVPPTTQIQMIKTLGMKNYRIAVLTDSYGKLNSYDYPPLKAAADNGGIKLIPCLVPRTLDLNVSTNQAYTDGKNIGQGFGTLYGKDFDYYELGNELEIRIIKAGTHGNKPEDYNLAGFRVLAAYLKGMDEGLKLGDFGAKTIINAGWVHYAYLEMLEDAGVNFDIVGYHWYSNMEGNVNKTFNIPDITVKLAETFKKPIWFTEVNFRNGSMNGKELEETDWLKFFIKKCKANPWVKGFQVYELLDEPQISKPEEKEYGLVKWTSQYSSWQYKAGASSVAY